MLFKTKSCLVFFFRIKSKYFIFYKVNVLLCPVFDRSSVREYGFLYNILVEGLRIKSIDKNMLLFLLYHTDRQFFFFKVSMLPILPFFEKTVCSYKKESSYFVLLTGKGTSVFSSFELEWY